MKAGYAWLVKHKQPAAGRPNDHESAGVGRLGIGPVLLGILSRERTEEQTNRQIGGRGLLGYALS